MTDHLFDPFKNIAFWRELDFGFESKKAIREKIQLRERHRAKYEGTLHIVIFINCIDK